MDGATYTLAVQLNQLDDWDLAHHQLRAGTKKTPFVPAISSALAGPLGAMHLPRLWLKRRAHAAGRLPEGYRLGLRGFDGAVAEVLGFDYDALAAYIDAEFFIIEARILAESADGALILICNVRFALAGSFAI